MVVPGPLLGVQLAELFQLFGVAVVFHWYTVCAPTLISETAVSNAARKHHDLPLDLTG
jgi:hypothetical protein